MKQLRCLFQLSRSSDLCEFVDVTWSPRHSFKVVARAVNLPDSFLLERLEHLNPQGFDKVLLTNVRIGVVAELNVVAIERIVENLVLGLRAKTALDQPHFCWCEHNRFLLFHCFLLVFVKELTHLSPICQHISAKCISSYTLRKNSTG